MNERQFRRTLIAVYIFRTGLGGMACCIPIIVLFWKKHGLSLTEIMVLQSIFAFLMVLFEVPSGYCADLWGRKRVLVLASIFLILGSGVYLFANCYAHFLLSELFFALAVAMISGADSSLLYDAMKNRSIEERFTKVWGSVQAVSLASGALFTSAGGILYEYGERLPFIASVGISAVTLPCALLMQEPERKKLTHTRGYLRGLYDVLYPAITGNSGYRKLLVVYAVVFTFVQAGLWFYQPYFQLCGIATFWFGFIFTGFNLAAAGASKFANVFDRHTRAFPFGLIPLILVAASYLGMSVCWFEYGFTIILIQQMVRGWFIVSISHKIHQNIRSEERATLLSLCCMSGSCAYAAFLPGIGLLADTFSIGVALQVCGVFCLVCAAAGMIVNGARKLRIHIFNPGSE